MLGAEQWVNAARFKSFSNPEQGYRLEIPTHWRLKAVSDEYGHSFSDEDGREGVLNIKPVVVPGNTLEEYREALQEGMEKEMHYKFLANVDTQAAGRAASEMTFFAPAYVRGKKKKAVMTVLTVDDSERYRYLVLSYSVLENEYEKCIEIYRHAKNSLRLI